MSQKRSHNRKSINSNPPQANSHTRKESGKWISLCFFWLEEAIFMLVLIGMIWIFKKEIEIWDILKVILLFFAVTIGYLVAPRIFKTAEEQANKPLTKSRVIISLLATDIVLQIPTTLFFYLSGRLVAAIISFCVINSIFIWIYISGKKAGRL